MSNNGCLIRGRFALVHNWLIPKSYANANSQPFKIELIYIACSFQNCSSSINIETVICGGDLVCHMEDLF